MSDENQACCACLNVEYKPEELGGGHMRERWLCPMCGMTFTKRPRVDKEIEAYQQTILYHYGFAMEESGLTREEYDEHLDAYILRNSTKET